MNTNKQYAEQINNDWKRDDGAPYIDDTAVDRFATQMKSKLARAREKGYGGWNNPRVCSIEHLASLLVGHFYKGNPGNWLDIANFAMMLHERGAPASLLSATMAAQADESASSENNDWKRLLWLIVEGGIDTIRGLNIHEEATKYVDGPRDYEYLKAIRNAIDEGIAESWGTSYIARKE